MGLEPDKSLTPQVTPVPDLGRRAQKKATVRESILSVARAAFVTNGVSDTDLVKIAADAGVGRATLYRYFDGKNALLTALVQDDWDKQAAFFQRLVDKPALDEATIRTWLSQLTRATAARVESFPLFYALGKEKPIMEQLDRQRLRLMAILSKRFEGFGGANRIDQVEALLVLFQIEHFVAHAAASKDVAEVELGTNIIARQLFARVIAKP